MKYKGPILLLITAVLWGFAFVAQSAGSADVSPWTFNASRNFIGVLFLTGVVAVRKRTGADKPPRARNAGGRQERSGAEAQAQHRSNADLQERQGGYTRKTLVVAGVACGVLLCVSSFLQQAGITSYPEEAAAAGRSGFITALYMVMVAVMALFAGKKLHPVVLAAVVVAIAGMYLLCVPDGLGSIYLGDWLTLACALGYALHIMVIDRYSAVDGVRLSRLQLLVAGSISLVCALLFEHPELAAVLAAAVPILYAGICSDGIAYTFQIIAQQTTDPTVASILMSLESVFAALGGWLVLSESLSAVELCGCALVFAAVMLAQVPDFIANARSKGNAGRAQQSDR